MINNNTLKILNKLAFGADIDSLESYVINFKQAQMVSDTTNYEDRYLKLEKILKEIKKESLAFSEKTYLNEIKLDKYDRYITSISNEKPLIIYGTQDNKLLDIANLIDESQDIIAIPYIDGINISITYINGYIYRIYAIGDGVKYIDLTKELKSKISNYIKEFNNIDLVELRGKVTIPNTCNDLQNKSLNTICSTMNCLRTKIDIDKLDIVITDILTNELIEYNNHWDRIEYLRDIGINVPHQVLIRGIDGEQLSQAFIEIDDYFNDVEIPYKYSGFEIRINTDIKYETNFYRVVYNSKQCNKNQLYKSTVKSITTSFKNNEIINILNIIPIECNNKVIIDNIEVDDIYALEKNNIQVGTKVIFNIIEGKAKIFNSKP